jgi:hypothetical protein
MEIKPNRIQPELVVFRTTKDKKAEFKKYAEAEHGRKGGMTLALNELMTKYIFNKRRKFENNPQLIIE